MKHLLLSLLSLILFFSVPAVMTGQNLMLNGDLENWPSATSPEGWDKAENIFQESVNVLNGASSARHESADGTQDFQQVVEGIIPGTNYTISYNFLDNDPAARTRIWSYWLSGDNTLTNDEEILRPSTYSEDSPDWQLWEAELTAPPTADAFRFEVRVYKQDGIPGGSVYYDDFEVSTGTILGEPTNYPTDFVASAGALNIYLTWVDAIGTQPPGAYLILGSDEDNIEAPVDGNFVSNDEDLSDGSGALNIPQGIQEASFSNLTGGDTYYFKIFPYTNGGSSVDYKTDGTAPSAETTIGNITVIESINFNFDFEDWTTISVAGNQVWENDNTFGLDDTPCAAMSGFSGGPLQNEDWLISPAMDFDLYEDETFEFWTATNFDGPQLEIKISNDYQIGDPNNATWDDLSAVLSNGGWEWTWSGLIDVSAYTGTVHVAFKYTSTDSEAATWEVDDVQLTGVESTGIDEGEADFSISVYPNPIYDFFVIEGNEKEYLYHIYTLDGKSVSRSYCRAGQKIGLGDVGPGFYLLEVTSPGSSSATLRKIVVSR